MRQKSFIEALLVFIVLLVVSLFLHRSHLSEFPRFIHSWTQSDRYALSLGFVENSLDLLHPQSFNLRPNPDHQPVAETGITPVDLPLPDFLTAIVMKISGKTGPGVFRVVNIILSCLGLMFLYLLGKRLTGSPFKAGVMVLFVLASPVYFYYQGGFIPSIASLSAAFAGAYFYYSQRSYPAAIYLFALAGMMRSPFLIPFLVASFLIVLVERKQLIHVLVSIALIAFLTWWNSNLASSYGSLFLRKLMHAENFQEILGLAKQSWKNWGTSWLTFSHYLFIGFAIVASVLIYFYPERDKSSNPPLKHFYFPLLWLGGAFVYFLLMEAQFVQHDYYFLDSFFGPLVILTCLLLTFIPLTNRHFRNTFLVTSGILLAFSANASFKDQARRRAIADWDRYEITYNNFENSSQLLEMLKIPSDSKMLVIDAYTVNAPLVLMNRKGYTVTNTNEKTITQALGWNYDYIVVQDQFLLSDVIRQYPPIKDKLKRVGGNGRISIFTYQKSGSNSFESLLGLRSEDRVGVAVADSCILNERNEFGCTINIPVKDLRSDKQHYVIVKLLAKLQKPLNEMYLVCDASTAEVHKLYQNFALAEYISGNEGQTAEFLFTIPKGLDAQNLKVYVWNPGNDDHLELRKFEVSWYKADHNLAASTR